MAELATIARPYAQALFGSYGVQAKAALMWVSELAVVAQNSQLLSFAANPNVSKKQIVDLVISVIKSNLDEKANNFLYTLIGAKRLLAMPEIAIQFEALVNAENQTRSAIVYSAFALDEAAVKALAPVLEKRFSGKLEIVTKVDDSLIGGIKVVVGDEVLDTSIKARLEQMKVVLTA